VGKNKRIDGGHRGGERGLQKWWEVGRNMEGDGRREKWTERLRENPKRACFRG